MIKNTLGRWAPFGMILLVACSEGSTGPQEVASVRVAPGSVTLAVGQSTSVAGTALDGDGNALTERTLTWSTENGSVASVTDAGVVTGVAEGSTSVTATADGVSGSATVTVQPAPVESVDVVPDNPSILPGETVRLTATPRDAQGNALTGRSVEWVSNNTSVATVDQDGLVTGVRPGEAIVFATSENASGESVIDVDNPNAPRITSVLPAEIVEGQPATINGANFSVVPALNVVTVDGVRATVTGGDATRLDIVVPGLDCKPRHMAEVAVSVGGDADETTHPARPGSFFQLAQGGFTLLQDPTSYCLQFDAATPDEEYLIGVQSTTENATSLTFAQVTGDADGSAPAAVQPRAVSPARSASPLEPEIPGLVGWRSREAETLQRDIEMVRRLPPSPMRGPALIDPPIPGTVTVGTPVTIRYPDRDFSDTCASYIEIQGTVRAVGTNAIWVGDDGNPANGYTDADYQSLADQFDADIYSNETAYFGLPTDTDANSRIVVVVTKEVNDDGLGGTVPPQSLYPRSQCASSNEGEYFFMFSPDPLGDYVIGPISRATALSAALPIIAHEFVHNIHVSRRGTNFWDNWQYEGQAVHGEEILGHALNGRTAGMNYDWAVVNNEGQTADRAWYLRGFTNLFLYFGWGASESLTLGPGTRVANAPEQCTWIDTNIGTNAGVCANRSQLVYGVAWTFMRWFTDHYSSAFVGGEAEMHTAWIDGAENGFASIEALTGQPIEELLAHWAASLYMDDRTSGLDPLITMPSYDLEDIQASVVPEARLEPRQRAFGDFSQSVQIKGASAAYFLVSGANRPSTAVRVRAPSGGFLSPNIQIWVARVR